jgi:large subunit ribosomal protein L13
MWGRAILLLSVSLASIKGESSPKEDHGLTELSDLLLALQHATSFAATRRAPVPSMAHHVQWKGAKHHVKTRPKSKLGDRARKAKYRAMKANGKVKTKASIMAEYKDVPWYTKTGSGEVPDPATFASPADKQEARYVQQKGYFPFKEDIAKKNMEWLVVDAEDARLGRLASEIAKALLGKNNPRYTPGQPLGDYVIVVNAEKVIVTGNKFEHKYYRRHSGRPGSMKIESFRELQARIPERIIEKAVAGMLPKNSYGRELFRRLKVYTGPEHPHEGCNPKPMMVNNTIAGIRNQGKAIAQIYKPWPEIDLSGNWLDNEEVKKEFAGAEVKESGANWKQLVNNEAA